MSLQPGDILRDRYRIEGHLGKGGMGNVFLGYDVTLDIKVAVKENINLNPESERQFHREARLLAALRHSNLPRVTDHFILEDRQYLVMDYIEGVNLHERMAAKRPSVDEVMGWADSIADALHYLHTRQPPIIHRDIKPANLKLQKDGKIVLVDFGIAKIFDQSRTTTGARGLTPGFSPPEQYSDRRTDARSDQYALAATLYLLLTNKRPADSIERTLGKETLTPIRQLHPDVPEHVEAALERGLALKQDQRFPDIARFQAALHDKAAFETIQVTIPSSEAPKPSATPKPKRRGRWIGLGVVSGLIAIVALALGLMGGIGGLLPEDEITSPTPRPTLEPLTAIEVTDEPSPTETLVPTSEPTPDTVGGDPISIENVKNLALQTTLQTEPRLAISTLDLSKDGRFLALSHWFDIKNALIIWDFQEETWIPSLIFHERDVISVVFSPTGNLMASASMDGMVALWEVGIWELVASFEAFPEGVVSLAFSPDESLLAVGGYHNQLGVWRLTDRERLNYYRGSGPHLPNKIIFTQDGREYYADNNYSDITAWSTANGEELRSFQGEACIGGFDLSSDDTKLAYSSSCSTMLELGVYGDPLVPIAVRDVASGAALIYGEARESSKQVYFTNDDTLILTNSGTGGTNIQSLLMSPSSIHFWNALDGTLVHQLPNTGDYVEFMLSDDGSLLIVGDNDGDVTIYRVNP